MAATRITLQVYLMNRKWMKMVPKMMAFMNVIREFPNKWFSLFLKYVIFLV